MKRIVSELCKSVWRKRACAVFVLGVTLPIALPAQTFKSLHSFAGTDGANPYAGLVQATNGSLYGTTIYGGANNAGTVFKITPGGTLTTLYSFCSQILCADGANPFAGLVQATDGNFYGTTNFGGANNSCGSGCGTVFKMTPGGTLTTLHSFAGTDGEAPWAGLIQATNGDLYGTTVNGGANDYGTFFKITTSGTLTTLYSFCSESGCADGGGPMAGLIQATNGDLYGTTVNGGANDYGTVFKLTPSGTLTTLYSFCSNSGCADGGGPEGVLVQATNGDLYGTTSSTVFKITEGGTLTTLYSFCSQSGCEDSSIPWAGLVQATNGDFYGTTQAILAGGYGTVFKITPGGTLTTLYSFDGTDGSTPLAGLVQATNGGLYGTTQHGGGTSNLGTIFRLSVGLGPFVKTLPAAGVLGEAVRILGYKLTGATSVTFNGVAAIFTVVSSTEITTTVPTGATTGKVQVVTPSETLSSNVAFQVVP